MSAGGRKAGAGRPAGARDKKPRRPRVRRAAEAAAPTSRADYSRPIKADATIKRRRGGARAGAGRKPYAPTEKDRRAVLAMTGAGITEAGIAGVLGIDPKTLRAHFREELDTGMIQANYSVAKSLYRIATSDTKEALPAAEKPLWLDGIRATATAPAGQKGAGGPRRRGSRQRGFGVVEAVEFWAAGALPSMTVRRVQSDNPRSRCHGGANPRSPR